MLLLLLLLHVLLQVQGLQWHPLCGIQLLQYLTFLLLLLTVLLQLAYLLLL
jgi:hypothetical protein